METRSPGCAALPRCCDDSTKRNTRKKRIRKRTHILNLSMYRGARPSCSTSYAHEQAQGIVHSRSRRHVDGELPEKFAIRVEYLDASIPPIAHIDLVVAVDHDRMWGVEFSRPGAVLAPRLHPVAILVVLGHPRVDIAVADIDV